MNESAGLTYEETEAVAVDADGGNEGSGAVAVAEKTALLVQLHAKLEVHEPVHKIVRQCNELRSILGEVLAIHFPDAKARVGAVSADDPSGVVFNVTAEQFGPVVGRHERLIHSFAEIPAAIRVLTDEQLKAAEKKPAGARGKKSGPVRRFLLDDLDDDETDGRAPRLSEDDED